ncbi:hypothetical protein ACFV1C_00510 [Streptomyces sp. NPDC059605]|uniref:hypothetical protein n=1 Tax=Streptomyces sp. NPDC059605 TaxID=3346882 RepID=UPI0036930CCA
MLERCRAFGGIVFRTITAGATIYGGHVGIVGLRSHDWIRAVGGTTALTIGTLIGIALLIRRWVVQHSETVRRDLERVAAERRAMETTARVVERQTEINQIRILGVERRLDETLNELSRERGQRLKAERELTELADEYNQLVRETLQAGYDRFAKPAERSTTSGSSARQRTRLPDVAARGDHE